MAVLVFGARSGEMASWELTWLGRLAVVYNAAHTPYTLTSVGPVYGRHLPGLQCHHTHRPGGGRGHAALRAWAVRQPLQRTRLWSGRAGGSRPCSAAGGRHVGLLRGRPDIHQRRHRGQQPRHQRGGRRPSPSRQPHHHLGGRASGRDRGLPLPGGAWVPYDLPSGRQVRHG